MELTLAYDILDILNTMQDAVKQMQKEHAEGNGSQFWHLCWDLQDGLAAVRKIAHQEIPKGSHNRLEDACICAAESLKDIKYLVSSGSDKAAWKLEYELGAIVEDMAIQFYYWGIVDEHPEKRENFLQYIARTDAFQILKEPEEERKYYCDLIILVIGYNMLRYTKECVQNILDNRPKKIRCEVVLYNHGSSDETKDYFESVEDVKVINVAVNGAVKGVLSRIYSRGRLYLQVSNDVLVGKNAIENLFRCVEEHPDYGFVVPSTPAVSNLQTIVAEYKTWEEFLEFTRNNNVYDEKRHEQRIRLCNPINIVRGTVYLQMRLDLYEDICCTGHQLAFPDDKVSLWMRRHGYKCILAKDAYCYHYGSVTIKTEVDQQEEQNRMYSEGRKAFLARYGVDPWGPGFCFEPELFRAWKIRPVHGACILGINCGLGSNSLKVKTLLREAGYEDACLVNCVQDGRYLEDLRGVSDEAYVFGRLSDIVVLTQRKWYDYVVVEEAVTGCEQEQLVRNLLHAGIEFGELVQKAEDGWRIYINSSAGNE